MVCFFPISNGGMEIRLFLLRPTVVILDDFLHSLKLFSASSTDLGSLSTSIFKSIHGNMVVWYGLWPKGSDGDDSKKILDETLLSRLKDMSSMAVLVDHGRFEAFAGEEKEGSGIITVEVGDTISIGSTHPKSTHDECRSRDDISYTCLALFRSHFRRMKGVSGGVCLRKESGGGSRIVSLHVWPSIQSCYSWVINFDPKHSLVPFLDPFSLHFRYDLFRAVDVRSADRCKIIELFSCTS